MKKKYSLILVALLSISFCFGQIYSEDFSGQNGKGAVGPTPTIDISSVTWSIDISNAALTADTDWFQVQNEVFEARDIDGDAIWYSPSINIASYTNVSFSLEASQAGTMEASDIFNTEYRIDGGAWDFATTNGNLSDDFISATVSQTGLSGNTLEIRVTLNNNAGVEYHRFDNLVVNGALSCTPPADPIGTISGNTSVCNTTSLLSFSGTAPANVVYYWQNTSLGTDQTNNASANLTVTTTGDYYVRAYNTVDMCWSTGEIGPYAVIVATSAPTITTQPSDLAVTAGASAVFTVNSSGAESYQWEVSTDGGTTWTAIGTDTNLTVSNIQATDDGNQYRVTLINACGITLSATATLSVTTATLYNPGELIFVGFDGQINGSGVDDQFLIATLVDMTPGTEFSLVNARYEAGAAANVRTEKWGGGSDNADEAPFESKITYNGSTTIPAGSVLRFNVNFSAGFIASAFVTEGMATTDRSTDFSANTVSSGTPNISTGDPDQMYLTQGNFTFDGVADTNEANYFFTGTLLHGITIGTPWVDLNAACSGGTSNSDRESRLPPELRCFNVEALTGIRGYYENDKEHGLATIRTIVNNVSDDAGNWNLGAYNWDPTNNTAAFGGRTFDVNISNPAGQWVGDVDINWFNCANWEGLAVPTAATNVIIQGAPTNNPRIDYTANYSDEYNDVAQCNDLTISASRLELQDNTSNVLEVQGDLTINGTGILDMDGTGTDDGVLTLFGNWINSRDINAFEEGNGTVIFSGTNPQTMTYGGGAPIPPPFESEVFNNLVLDNDFDIAQTDRSIRTTNNLTINAGRSLNVQSFQFVEVGNRVINNGDFTLQDSASLIQINDVTNVGDLTMNRNYVVDSQYDYIYWSSPIANFNTADLPISGDYIYSWNPTAVNPGTGEGNWESAVGVIMEEGKGYIARVPAGVNGTTVFQNGVPNNGDVNLLLARGTDATSDNDDWNLIGNPYPSAISADVFITDNPEIDGFINLWTHGTDPNDAIIDPFYENDNGYNYNSNDYITYNLTGTTNGPSGFTGFIAAGQAFMVNTDDGPADSNLPISFTNSMRQRDYDNSNFYRTNPLTNGKHRIWLDFGLSEDDSGNRIVIGYVPTATMDEDRLYDAKWVGEEEEQRFYSIINHKEYLIQGRALPFSDDDVVSVGYNATISGNYKIAIFAVDGLFEEESQNIYLKDNLLGLVHNLSSNPYSFSSEIGEYNERFEIVFRADALSIDDDVLKPNELTVTELSDGDVQIKVNSHLSITNVEIIDILGRQVYNLKGDSSVEVYDLSKLSNAAYIAKVTLSNGQVISKKAVKRK